MLVYHFHNGKLRDGRPLPDIGEWLEHYGPIIPCKSGLHGSVHPFDALQYAPGPYLDRDDLDGDLVPNGDPIDKWCGRRRMRLATIDATDLLREFARWCVLQVIHLWDATDVVRRFLETGDETLREAAHAAARSAELEAAKDKARYAALDAISAAVWASYMEEATSAAQYAAVYAIRAVSWHAAMDGDKYVGSVAAELFMSAAIHAAVNAATTAQRDKFKQMVEEAFEKAGCNVD